MSNTGDFIPSTHTGTAYHHYDWYVPSTATASTTTISHMHDFIYSGRDSYGDIATCRGCGDVKRTMTKLGEK